MGRPKILVAEDDYDLQELIGLICMGEGFEPYIIPNILGIREAVEKNVFQAALVDLTLVDGHGEEAVWSIREHAKEFYPEIFIISGQDNIAQRCRDMHVQGYLRKPFNIDQLLDLLRKIKTGD